MIVCAGCGSPDKELLCLWSGDHFHAKPFRDDPQMARELGVFTACSNWNCAMKIYQRYLEYLRVAA